MGVAVWSIERHVFIGISQEESIVVDRTPLRRKLLTAWEECIEKDYPRHLINSEHGLQAVLYHRLRDSLSKKWMIFVEPSFPIPIDGKNELIPDLLICNSRRIIAVIELKYQPRVKMDYAKDLRTLAALAMHSGTLTMHNERYLGLGSEASEFCLAEDAIFVWAGVHRTETGSEAIDLRRSPEGALLSEAVEDRFFQLHAVTNPVADPSVLSLPELD